MFNSDEEQPVTELKISGDTETGAVFLRKPGTACVFLEGVEPESEVFALLRISDPDQAWAVMCAMAQVVLANPLDLKRPSANLVKRHTNVVHAARLYGGVR